MKLNGEKPRGVLNPAAGAAKFQLARYAPAPDCGYFVQRYWMVEWHLGDCGPHLQETLPYPCVNLVFQQGGSSIFGVISGKFSILLENDGWAFGVKFRPGAFYPFVNSPISQFTDRAVAVGDIFGADGMALEAALLAQSDAARVIELFEQFLRARLPEHDQHVDLINQIVDQLADGEAVNWAKMALDLGYFDQAHFIKDFKTLVGRTPAEYARQVGAAL